MKLKRAVGIDLGTTNSALAMMPPTGHDIWMSTDAMQRRTVPSVVGWDPEADGFVTGWEAWNRRLLSPRPVHSIKRKMGQSAKVEVGPHMLSPEEVSAKILEALAAGGTERFAEKLGDQEWSVGSAVITVPAYFDAPQIEATKRAGELAGLDVVGLVQEPTAAAMYHAWKRGTGDATFLVFDLGGGTFDVSVIRSLMGEYQVLGIDGDNVLGGDDFDRRLAEHFRQKLVDAGYQLDLDVAGNAEDATRFLLLTRIAQEAKEALSSADVHYVGRRDLFEDQEGTPVTLDFEIDRATFEGLIEDLVDGTIECCHRAVSQAVEAGGLKLDEIDHVLLVGGSTRVPLVRQKVIDAFCSGQTKAHSPWGDEPDTCVALGAAIHAATTRGAEWIDDGGVALRTLAPLYSNADSGRIVGRLTGAENDSIDSIALFSEQGDVVAVSRPEFDDQGDLICALEDVPLHRDGENSMTLEFCDVEGEPLYSFPIALFRGGDDEYRPTGSALSNPGVLAKDIYLEILRDGRSDRQILVARGTGLPTRETFRFYTADQSGAVILRLFQNRYPIRSIHLAIPEETEVGSAVDLDLDIDEAMTIVAAGEVAGQKFWAQIEAPPEREARDWEQIEALLDRADEVERLLWGYESRHFRREIAPIVAGIRETARTDPDKLQVLVVRLEDVLEDYSASDAELTPGWGRLVVLLDAIKRTVYQGDGAKQLGLSTDQWIEKLQEIETRAREVYDAHDRDGWTQVFNQVQAIWESLAQEEYRFRSSDPDTHLVALAASLTREIETLRGKFEEFPFAGNPETRELQEREVARLRAQLNERVAQPLAALDLESLSPSRAKPELDRLWETATHVRKQFEKVPNIGLVSRG